MSAFQSGPRRKRKRRQRPKRSYKVRRVPGPPVSGPPPPGPGMPPGGSPGVVTVDLSQPLPVQETTGTYPGADERHAVTTNQEPAYGWPPVDLPPLQGFTVGDHPIDNGQAYMSTTYETSAEVSDVPYYDYDTGADVDEDTGGPSYAGP